jgi:hypothetical protein
MKAATLVALSRVLPCCRSWADPKQTRSLMEERLEARREAVGTVMIVTERAIRSIFLHPVLVRYRHVDTSQVLLTAGHFTFLAQKAYRHSSDSS